MKQNQEAGAAIFFMIALVNIEVSAYEAATTRWVGAAAFGVIGIVLFWALYEWIKRS